MASILNYHLSKMGECIVARGRFNEGPASVEFVRNYLHQNSKAICDSTSKEHWADVHHALTKVELYFSNGPDGEVNQQDARIYSHFVETYLMQS